MHQLSLLVNAHMRGLRLTHARMPGANLSMTDISGAHLQGEFNGAVIENAIITATTFEGDWSLARFGDCEVSFAYFGNCSLRKAIFEATERRSFDNVCFWLADLAEATFQGAQCGGLADFRWANLRDATFTGIEDEGTPSIATFHGARLAGTDFLGVKSSVLKRWDFKEAIVVDAHFPSNFDPVDAGALVAGSTDVELIRDQELKRLDLQRRREPCPEHRAV